MANEESHTFSVSTDKDPQTLAEEDKKVAEENGATFRGDENSGSFSGSGVEGSYEVEGTTVQITVTEKPGFVPWSTVESQVEEFFR